jgi:hypothetical protein
MHVYAQLFEGSLSGCSSCASSRVLDRTLCVTVVLDHRHRFYVPIGDLVAGATKTYRTSTDDDHSHSITLTPDHFAELVAGRVPVVETSQDNKVGGTPHTHTSTSCAYAAPRSAPTGY